jgi:hypothetical protein
MDYVDELLDIALQIAEALAGYQRPAAGRN